MMKKLFACCVLATLPLMAQVLDGQAKATQEFKQTLDKKFHYYETASLDLDSLARKAEGEGQIALHWQGQALTLVLEPNPIQSKNLVWMVDDGETQWEEPSIPFATYRGSIAGDPNSIVRMLIEPDLIMGYVRTADRWIFVDALSSHFAEGMPGEVVLYESDQVYQDEEVRCGALEVHDQAKFWQEKAREKHGSAQKSATLKVLEVATDADGEYYVTHLSPLGVPSVNAYITGILNGVDGIFTSEINVTLQISFQNVNTSIQFDPYNSTNPCTILGNEMPGVWNAAPFVNQPWDVVHLFTGKTLGSAPCLTGNPSNIVGLANIGVVCANRSISMSLSQDYTTNQNLLVKLVSHEFGHNFGALHIDPPATCNGNGLLMCSNIQNNGPNVFSNQSDTIMCNHVANFGCCLDNPNNQPPIANCIPNLTFNAGSACSVIVTPGQVNAGSFDPDGCNFIPMAMQLSPAGPYGLGTTVVTLTVTDAQGASDSCTTTITVNGTNNPPLASAGTDRTIDEGTLITINGSGSDPDPGQTVTFSWVQTAGPAVTLLSPTTATPSFLAPAVPLNQCVPIRFQLTVTDSCGATTVDTVNFNINDVLILQDVGIRNCMRIFPCTRSFVWRLVNGTTVRGVLSTVTTGGTISITGRTPTGMRVIGTISGGAARARIFSAAGAVIGQINDANINNNFPCP